MIGEQMKNDNSNSTETQEQTTQTDATEEVFVSSSQRVSDELESKAFGEPKEESVSLSDESQPSKESKEENAEEKGVEVQPEQVETKEKKTPFDKRKENLQKEINRLIAQKNSLQDDLDKSKVNKPETQEKKDPDYTDEQLNQAIKKMIDEDKPEGILDIINYKVKKMEDALVSRYENDKQSQVKQVEERNKEWQGILKDYSKDSYDDDWMKEDPDFDMSDKNSLIYTVAKEFFEDSDLFKARYQGAGGMRIAVQDAYSEILKQKLAEAKTKPEPKDNKEKIVRKNMKESLTTGANSSGEENNKPSNKPYDEKEDLAEVMSERKKFKAQRAGAV